MKKIISISLIIIVIGCGNNPDKYKLSEGGLNDSSDTEMDMDTETLMEGETNNDERDTEYESNTGSDTESDADTNTDTDTDTVGDSDTDTDTDIHEDTEADSDTDTDTDNDTDTDMDTDSDTNTNDDMGSEIETDMETEIDTNADCPGSCQNWPITPGELISSGIVPFDAIGPSWIIDSSLPNYLLCDNGADRLGYDTAPDYTGWIRDNHYYCPHDEYCCRPQIASDQYCPAGYTCEASNKPGEGPGFCAFASSGCGLEPEWKVIQ